jgi:tRNA (guanine37-N1)-methyltransferase
MRFDLLTLFPELFSSFLGESLLHKAIAAGKIEACVHDLRAWSVDKHQKMDDRPFGGGPGMVLMVEPVVRAVRAVQAAAATPGRLIMLSPQGRRLDQRRVEQLAREPRLVLLCGRYEGFDERVRLLLEPEEISIGDYVLNGGEVAAMVIVEAVMRLVPGVLGDDRSSVEDSFSGDSGWLEGPQYTRPREFAGFTVPEVLLSGDHAAIARWRQEQSRIRTATRRADLLAEAEPPRPDSANPPN